MAAKKDTAPSLKAVITPKADVILLNARRGKPAEPTIRTLEALLTQAKAGQILGLAFAVDYGGGRHDPGASGTYREDPVLLRGAAAKLMQVAGSLDEEGRHD